ncbi:MAG: PLP-dependent transferase [Flavobacteriaceae bacterium]
MAAIDSVLKLLSTGDEIVAVDDIYKGRLPIVYVYEKLGIHVTYVDTAEVNNICPGRYFTQNWFS